MKSVILFLFACAAAVASAATPFPPAAPPYYRVEYAASQQPGELAMGVTYTVWMPPGVKQLRGVIVHQHGCGISSAEGGRTAAYDLHWQALAKKWDCALMGPSYHLPSNSECRNWCDPRRGSDKTFLRALSELGAASQHPELATVPWCLWGHSGGGFWSSLMLTLHPERIAAIFYRSGSAYAIWQRGEIPAPTLTPAVYDVPFMFIGGDKEAEDKSHGPARIGDRAMLKDWRGHGAPGGLSLDPLSGHECGDSRYLAIAFFDACLRQRLPAPDAKEQSLRPIDWSKAWLAAPETWKAEPAAEFKGDQASAHWLPDAEFAQAWMHYCAKGRPADATPPPPPSRLILTDAGQLTWSAEADFESGLAGFIIERDGKTIARLPEKPAGKSGTPLFQGLSGGDTPLTAFPVMQFTDPDAKRSEVHEYRVTSVNAAGLHSLPATVNLVMPSCGLCAHRGAMSSHPENTIPAFEEAVRLGAQMVEFDLQLTQDGALVLMHDLTVDRTTDGKGKVTDLTLAQIKALDAGAKMNAKFAGTRVPNFEEALAVFPENVWLNCHLKGGADVGAAAARIIQKAGRKHQAFLAATADAAIGARAAVPDILICNMERQSNSMAYAEHTITAQGQFIQLLGKGEVPADVIALLRESGIFVNYYHDESPEGLRRQWQAGVNFPLVNDLAAAIPVAKEFGIAALR